jgi:TRAP transporter 4TM/12TM fusion protein
MNLLDWIGSGRSRTLGPVGRLLSAALSLTLAVIFIAVAAGVYIDEMIGLFLFLGGVLALAFLHTTGNARRPTSETWSGWLLTLSALGCCAYFIAMHDVHKDRLPVLDPLTSADVAVSVVLIALVLEATRRTIGIVLVLLVGLFLGYAGFGDKLTGAFSHRGMSLPEMIDQLVFTNNGLYGPALEVAAYLVFIFVLFGALLDRFGGGDFFHDFSNALVGRQVGGPAKVAVLSSGLYGSISGSPTADVVTTGSFTIPLMIRTGFTRVRAGAIEAAASTGGAILPPVMGSAAFMMSDFTGIPYGEIALVAIIPGLLYYLCVYLAVTLQAYRAGLQPLAQADIPKVGAVLRRDWIYLIPLITIAWAVLALNRPAFAGAVACLALVPVILLRCRPLSDLPKRLAQALIEGMQRMITVGVACAVAGLVIGTLSMTDLSGKISSGLFLLASGNFALTIFTAIAVVVVLGMGMPVPAVYALSAVLAAPALVSLGLSTMASHLLVVYYAAVSAITPPVAVAAFAAASIAKANPMPIGFLACRIAAVAFIAPVVFVARPELLLEGPALDIIGVCAATALGSILLTIAFEDYLFGALGMLRRVLFCALSLCMLAPVAALNAVAAIVALAWIGWRYHRSARTHPAGDRPPAP